MARFLFALAALCALAPAAAFMPIRSPVHAMPVSSRVSTSRRQVVSMGVVEAINAYVDIWSPTVKSLAASAEVNPLVIKWFHGANMATVLFTMASFGSFLGWKIRAGEGDMVFTGKTARELHPLLMGGATLFFFLGGQGGLVLLDVMDKPLLESPHAITAGLGLGLLGVQAFLPRLFEDKPTLRTAHAYLGSATMLLLFVHAALGLNLGLSI